MNAHAFWSMSAQLFVMRSKWSWLPTANGSGVVVVLEDAASLSGEAPLALTVLRRTLEASGRGGFVTFCRRLSCPPGLLSNRGETAAIELLEPKQSRKVGGCGEGEGEEVGDRVGVGQLRDEADGLPQARLGTDLPKLPKGLGDLCSIWLFISISWICVFRLLTA